MTAAPAPAPTPTDGGTAVGLAGLTKRFGRHTAVDGIDLEIRTGAITGLLGRNGAGKSTLLQLISGHLLPTGGSVSVFGQTPHENAAVASGICLAREAQRYPDGFRVRDVVTAIGILYPGADRALADELVATFDLPLDRRVKKLSRGMRAALSAVIGLSSRAPLTLLDEPYLGLDAVARQTFYDALLADYAEHPRTIVLTTHLIDEVRQLVEQVVVIDHGRLLLDAPLEDLRRDALEVSGPRDRVRELADRYTVLTERQMAGTARVVVRGVAGTTAHDDARRLGLEARSLTLQELFVAVTSSTTLEVQP